MIPEQRTEQIVALTPNTRSPQSIADARKALRARIVELTRMMNQMEDKATYHFNCYLRRKDEIRLRIQNEHTRSERKYLGSDIEHLVDEATSNDTAAGSHAANNKWYISQATMYATMCQVEISRYREELY
jgi:hypothetical protein